MRLVILIGASGSGKTAIAEAIAVEYPGLVEVLHFDRIGVPSPEEMTAGWGSGEAWQRATTLGWIARIATMRNQDRPVLFEGQTRLASVREGLLAAGISDAQVILVDCDDATRTRRLTESRRQPDLANPEMMNWAAFLRRDAQEAGCDVLDTSHLSLADGVEYVRAQLLDAIPKSSVET